MEDTQALASCDGVHNITSMAEKHIDAHVPYVHRFIEF